MPKRLRYALYAVETFLVNSLIVSSLYQFVVYLTNRRFWRQLPTPAADTAPSVSVIVPLRNKTPDTLAHLHVLAISGPSDDYEVILVLEDEHSPAYVVAQQVAASYPDHVRIVLCGPPGDHVHTIHSQNAGYLAARGNLLAFVEPNSQLSGELWHAALAAMADPGVGAAFAPPLIGEPERRGSAPVSTGGEMLTAMHINHAHTAGLPFAALSNRVKEMASGFIVIRREVLDAAGGLLHLLDDAAAEIRLGRVLHESGTRIAVIHVPVYIVPERETFNEATAHLLRILTINRAYNLRDFLAWPFTNPLTVGFILGWITEREDVWWGRRTWWFFAWLRMALAFELDRIRFGHGFNWTAYAQLFMLDTFISPALWTQALFRRIVTWPQRTYRIYQGGKAIPLDDSRPNTR